MPPEILIGKERESGSMREYRRILPAANRLIAAVDRQGDKTLLPAHPFTGLE